MNLCKMNRSLRIYTIKGQEDKEEAEKKMNIREKLGKLSIREQTVGNF